MRCDRMSVKARLRLAGRLIKQTTMAADWSVRLQRICRSQCVYDLRLLLPVFTSALKVPHCLTKICRTKQGPRASMLCGMVLISPQWLMLMLGRRAETGWWTHWHWSWPGSADALDALNTDTVDTVDALAGVTGLTQCHGRASRPANSSAPAWCSVNGWYRVNTWTMAIYGSGVGSGKLWRNRTQASVHC